MPDHDAASRTVDRFRTHDQIDPIADGLQSICRDFGLVGFFLLRLRSPGAAPSADPLARGWPEEWVRRYAGEDRALRDPVRAHARTSLRPFTWSEALRLCPLPGADALQAEAAGFGLVEGVVVPVHGPGGRHGLVSFAAERLALAPRDVQALHLAAIEACAQVAVFDARRQVDGAERLTPREIDCLRWAADGKTSWEIAQILSISQHTTDWYLTSAARKLRAASRVQAVAEAFRRGLIC